MLLRDVLDSRYAVLHNLSERTVLLMQQTLDRFRDYLGHEPTVDDLTDLAVSGFVRWRSKTHHRGRLPSAATTRKDLAHITALWNHLARKRATRAEGTLVEFPDLPRNLIRVPISPPRGYTVAQVSAIIRAGRRARGSVGPVPAAWFWTTLPWAAWITGERIGALLRLRWSEVSLEHCRITFLGATRKDRTTTIVRDISAHLASVMVHERRGPADLVWPWIEFRQENTVFPALARLCRAAGVPCHGFHGFRKSSGSYVKAAGGDATEHLGHKNARTTQQHYLDTEITGQQSALDYLPPLDLG